MSSAWRHNFARLGDVAIAVVVSVLLTTTLVVVGLRQINGVELDDFQVWGTDAEYPPFVLMSGTESSLASVAFTHVPNAFASYGGDLVELEEIPFAWRRLCNKELQHIQPEDYDEHTSGASVRAGWPLQIELLGDRTKEWPWELQTSWLGVTLINDGQDVGTMPYRPAILPLLANILLFALPLVILLGLTRTQIALVRAARNNCTACGYPRPKTTCPECGQEH